MPRSTLAAPELDASADLLEDARLNAVDSYDILDTPAEPAFDRVARLVKNIFNLPIALVSIIDGHRQWYKASQGMAVSEVNLPDTFCRQILFDRKSMIVTDATNDQRFDANPFVTNAPRVRFYAGAPLTTADGHVIGTVCGIDTKPRQFTQREVEILEDLAETVMELLELRRSAATDFLTGVLARRGLREAASPALMRSRRHGHKLSGLVLDIDHFKSVNDTYGHAAGDEVLKSVAQVCAASLRETDVFGRLGGEEFGAVLEHVDLEGAYRVAEKLRLKIENRTFTFGEHKLHVTASFGVAQLTSEMADIDALFAGADAALYQAKASGRNRTVRLRTADTGGRRRVLKAGSIIFNRRNTVIDCTVRSMSEKGARLDVSNPTIVQERFELAIRSDGFEVPCRIVSQTDKHIEVEFT